MGERLVAESLKEVKSHKWAPRVDISSGQRSQFFFQQSLEQALHGLSVFGPIARIYGGAWKIKRPRRVSMVMF